MCGFITVTRDIILYTQVGSWTTAVDLIIHAYNGRIQFFGNKL